MPLVQKTDSTVVPPGKLGLPFVGETFSFITDPLFAVKKHRQYGPIFKSNILGNPTIFVQGADFIQFILSNENKYFVVSLPYTIEQLLGAKSLSVQTGAEHQSRRKVLYKAFQPRALNEYTHSIQEITHYYLAKWAATGCLVWYPQLQQYTFDVACKLLISLDNASQTNLGKLYETWSEGLFSLPVRQRWMPFGRALRCRQLILDEVAAVIRERQQQPNFGTDALGILLEARDETGNDLPLEEIKDQILMLLFAGHGTLTSALASFCLLVAQHPEVLERCREEQQIHQLNGTLNADTLRGMTYLDRVIQEVLRLIPPVGGGFRKVLRHCEFNGYQFPEGWNVIYEISLTHQNELLYCQPGQFNPDRFSQDCSADQRKPFSYVPFGGGIRECLGKELARLEMKLFATHLIRDYEWELEPSQNLNINPIPVPHPRDGLKVKLRRR